MRLGKIDYINLLPFHVYIKSLHLTHATKKFIEFKKSYPSKLNQDFLTRRIDSGFISSIAARGKRITPAGIVAKGEVWSVLVIKNEEGEDYQSATSNALAKVLGLKGKVLIGDRALSFYLQKDDKTDLIDMGKVWQEKYKLPFVFGRFCYNTHVALHHQIAKNFVHKNIKIPHYIMQEYMNRSGLKKQHIKEYLMHISYQINKKERLGIKKFYRLCDELKIKRSKRF